MVMISSTVQPCPFGQGWNAGLDKESALMMDFTLTEEQRMLKETVANFAAREIQPIAEEIDRTDTWPDGMWKKLGDLGVLGVTIEGAYGGVGLDILSGALVGEELAKVSPSISISYGAHANLCCNNIRLNGTETQKHRYLPPLCSGDQVGALGLTEPNAGSDAVSIQTTARREGDHFVVNGSKTFITNGVIADTIILYAKTDKAAGARGITAFILEKGFPGFSVSRKLDKVGNRGSETGELVMEDCLIPQENVIGQLNGGVAVMMRGLDIERAFLSTYALGMAEGAFAEALKYARERVQFGKPIASFQLIQAKLADMWTLIEAARLLSYKACILADAAERGGKGTELHKVTAAAVLFVGEMADKVCTEAVQIHGGYGYCMEYPVQRFWRDAKVATIGAGTSEMRRLILARELLAG